MIAAMVLAALGPWSFVSLDRPVGLPSASASLQTGFMQWSDGDGTPVDVIANRLDLHGELPIGPWGVTATLPVLWVHGYDEHTGTGASQIGGYRAFQIGGGTLRLRAGLVLPTERYASDDGYEERLAGEVMTWHRLEEPTADLGTTWLRVGATGRLQHDAWSFGLDTFVEKAFDEDFAYMVDGPPLRVSVGAGVGRELGPTQATFELVTSGFPFAKLGLVGDGQEFLERMIFSGALSLAGRVHGIEIRGSFQIPLDRYARSHVKIIGLAAGTSF